MSMRTKIGFLALLVGAVGVVGCGDVSYFDVTVTVNTGMNISESDLTAVNTCQVHTSGAASDIFTMDNCAQGMIYTSFLIGEFQYGTSSGSGTVNFDVILKDGSGKTLAEGSNGGSIVSGKHAALTVAVDPKVPSVWN
jgi:hypothetical protein